MNKLEDLLQNYPSSETELFAFLALEEKKQMEKYKNLKLKKKLGKNT